MNSNHKSPGNKDTTASQSLRRKALGKLPSGDHANTDAMSEEEIRELVYDLEVHQAELTTARNRYRDLYEYAPVGYLTLDPEGLIREANLKAGILCNRERSWMIGRRMEEIVRREDRDICYFLLRESTEEHTESRELRLNRPDNATTWVCADATRLPPTADKADVVADGYRVTLTDITQRKREQQSRDRDRELLIRLVDNIPVMIVNWNADLDRFELNAHVIHVLGYTVKDANRGNFMASLYPDAAYRAQVEECMKSLWPGWHEWTPLAKDGTPVPSTWCNIKLSNNSRVGIGIDLRERKRFERELAQINEELEQRVAERTAESEARASQLQRLAAELSRVEQKERKRLAHILHDDVQQILAAARFPVDRLHHEINSEGARGLAAKADGLISQAIGITRNLSHDLAPQTFSDCNLAEGLNWCAEWCRDRFNINVEVATDAAASCRSEETRLFLLESVRELLFNIHKHAETNEAEIRMTIDRSILRIAVIDHGKGGNFRGSPAASDKDGGFGLFSISERLDALGGSLLVRTHPGDGTEITLSLPVDPAVDNTLTAATPQAGETVPSAPSSAPITEPDAPAVSTAVTPEPNPGDGRIRILLVDDHEMMREGLCNLLNSQPDMQIIAEADNGTAAVELGRQLEPDIVIMDVRLPEMDGIAATRCLKKAIPGTHIIGLSMYEDSGILHQMLKAGATVQLSKSGHIEQLLKTIRELV